MPDSKAEELFRREIASLRVIDHPRIPRFVDAFEEGTGPALRWYLAQTYVSGEDLEQRIEHHRFDEAEARLIAESILDALV